MSDPYAKPDVQSISEVISDALMRANTMTACVVIYTNKEGEVCTSFASTRVERLGMLTHVLFHEMAKSVKEVDDYESEEDSSE
jgi:hypothetical protein